MAVLDLKCCIQNVSGPIKSLFEIVFGSVLNTAAEENYGLFMYTSTADLKSRL